MFLSSELILRCSHGSVGYFTNVVSDFGIITLCRFPRCGTKKSRSLSSKPVRFAEGFRRTFFRFVSRRPRWGRNRSFVSKSSFAFFSALISGGVCPNLLPRTGMNKSPSLEKSNLDLFVPLARDFCRSAHLSWSLMSDKTLSRQYSKHPTSNNRLRANSISVSLSSSSFQLADVRVRTNKENRN